MTDTSYYSFPLQKLHKHSQGLAPKDLPFRALPPKSPSNSPHLNSTLSPALPGVRPPVLPGRPRVPRPLGAAGHSLRGPPLPSPASPPRPPALRSRRLPADPLPRRLRPALPPAEGSGDLLPAAGASSGSPGLTMRGRPAG